MKVLALDCAGSGCAVSLWEDGAVLSLVEEKMERGQDSRLIPMVQEAMGAAHVSYADIDRIAVTRGPGSFTGLRIGISCARGIALAAQKPVLGIDRFSVHHAQHKDRVQDLLVVLESRRAELYTRFYPTQPESTQEPRLLTAAEIAVFLASPMGGRVYLAGDALPALQAAGVALDRFLPLAESEAVTCAALAALVPSSLQTGADFLPRPLYLRAPDVTFAKPLSGTCS